MPRAGIHALVAGYGHGRDVDVSASGFLESMPATYMNVRG